MSQTKTIFTTEEVANALRLDLLTIYKYIRDKKLAAIRFGRSYRIKKEDLDLFITEHRTF